MNAHAYAYGSNEHKKISFGFSTYRWLLFIFWIILPSVYFFRTLLLNEALTLLRDVFALPLIFYVIMKIRRRKFPFDVGILLFYAPITLSIVVIVSLVVYQQPLPSIIRMARILVLSPLFIFLAYLIPSSRHFVYLVKGMVVVAILSVLYGWRQEIWGYTSFERAFISSSISFSSRDPEHFFRIFSIWGSPTVFAAYLLCTLWCFIAVHKHFFIATRWRIILKLLIILVLISGILLSKMRIFQFALIIGCFVYGFYLVRQNILRLLFLAFGGMSLVFLASYLISGQESMAFLGSGMYRGTLMGNITGRLELWADWLNLLGMNLFGLGLNARLSLGMTTPDNSYMDILIRTGWIGMLIYVYLLLRVAIVPTLNRISKSETPSERAFWSAIAAMMSGSLVAGTTSSVFVNSIYAAYFWTFAGLAFAGLQYVEIRTATDTRAIKRGK